MTDPGPDAADRAPAPVPVVPVVAAVIRREGAVLLGLRPAHKRHGSRWEFPGGKVLDGESLQDALVRELREELRVRVIRREGEAAADAGTPARAGSGSAAGPALFVARDPGSPFEIHFVEVAIEGTPEAVEHQEVRWVAPADLASLPLAPADARFAREVLGS